MTSWTNIMRDLALLFHDAHRAADEPYSNDCPVCLREELATSAFAALEPEPGCTTGCRPGSSTFKPDDFMTWPFACIYHQAERRRALERDEPDATKEQ